MLDIFYYFIKNTVSLSRRDLCLPHQHPISTHASADLTHVPVCFGSQAVSFM